MWFECIHLIVLCLWAWNVAYKIINDNSNNNNSNNDNNDNNDNNINDNNINDNDNYY